MTDHAETSVREEQERVDVVYARLDQLRAVTERRLAEVRRAGPSGSPQNRSERDAFAALYEDRLAQLRAVEDRLVFGRLYLRGDPDRYIGRIGLSDAAHVPLLTDWRAPAAQPFYQATSAAPGDVVRRRHLLTRARQVVGVEDEVLDLGALPAADVPGLAGEGALFAALGAARTGRMHDIVATIQAEQDSIIRSDLAGVLVVQGGPGTGKTAVALHRAAYLLYAHREKLERSGVLLIGPSGAFLRYIEQVLPSLGETGVVSMTVADLIPGLAVGGEETEAVARIKGRAVFSRVLVRAVHRHQRILPEQELRVGSRRLVLRPDDVREAQAKARRASRLHNVGRVTFVRSMLARLSRQYADLLGGALSPEDLADLAEEIRVARDVRVALNLSWMPLTPQSLLEGLYAKPDRLAEAAPELTESERSLLSRERGAPWTPADVPLLDEAAELLGDDDSTRLAGTREAAARRDEQVRFARETLAASGAGGGLVTAEMLAARFAESGPVLTTAERAASDRTWTYGHVIVDEAQELSPMAWRALLRRVPTRSMTVVGDLGQSSATGVRTWEEALDRPLRGAWRLAELTVSYRTPAAVMSTAAAVAHAAGHRISAVRSARDLPDAVRWTRADGASLAHAVLDVVRAESAELGSGRIAVLTAPRRTAELRDYLASAARGDTALAAGLSHLGGDPLGARVAVLDPVSSKGLEFDVVILVEPAEIAETRGASDLYVAMTRPTRRLHVVHRRGLPVGFPPPGTSTAGSQAAQRV